jgi:hypothetical protein
MLKGILICFSCKYCKNEKKYHIDDVLMSHLINHEFMEDYQYWNKYGEEGLNEAEMRDSYPEMEVPNGLKEEHDDVNEADLLGLIDDDIEFQVYTHRGDGTQYRDIAMIISTVITNLYSTRR